MRIFHLNSVHTSVYGTYTTLDKVVGCAVIENVQLYTDFESRYTLVDAFINATCYFGKSIIRQHLQIVKFFHVND